MHVHAGLRLDPPADFVVDQTMISFRAPPPVVGDPRVLQKQTAIRPSLIVHRRDVGLLAPLEILAGEVTAELVSSVAGLSGLSSETFTFADGAVGIIISFDFAAAEVGTARQYHALRKDDAVLTTLTLTLDKLTLTEETRSRWLALFASAVKDGTGALS
jgi:hypothetical protein